MNLKEFIRIVPDFPQPGISFKDITTLLKEGDAYREAVNQLKALVEAWEIDKIAGPEARGFVIGAPLSYALGVGFVPIRKSGKLPAESISAGYELEYGKDQLAVHKDAIQPGERVLIADDLLATGGTISTCINLVEALGGQVVGAAFLIELAYLNGREKIGDKPVVSLLSYDEE
jgi:adenine phosphoribosyltransferase